MHKIAIFSTLALCTIAFACSEADDGATTTFGVDAGNTGNTSVDAATAPTSTSTSSSPPNDASAPTQVKDGGAIVTALVVNEISGKGAEWIEIFNAGSTALDVSGYGITDREKDGGAPKMSDAITFPANTVLSPNSYLLVAEPAKEAGAGEPACPAGGQSYCFAESFGISNSDGDTVFILDLSQNVIEQVDYPANVVATGQTWGRLPSATGAFAVNQPTPGAVNKSP